MSKSTLRSLTLAIALSAASFATADTYFENGNTLVSSDVLELGLITADGAGVVEVYDFHTGEMGALLGTESIQQGANTDVRVNTGARVSHDVLVVVRVGGQIAAQKEFDINSN